MRALIVVIASLISVAATAATEITTVSAEATGIDREQAIYNALGEAVRQVRGAEISASRQVRSALARMTERGDDGKQSTTTMSSSQASETRVTSSGLISGYRIISVQSASGGAGKLARLEVDVPVYKAPGSSSHDNRWRLAVYPVEAVASHYAIAGQRFTASQVSERLTHSISGALTQSRRFAMLARDSESAIKNERVRMTGSNVPIAEKAMLGNELGAEYLVVARATDLSIGSKVLTSDLTGEKRTVSTGAAVLEVRVVVPATGGIVWSQTVTMSADQLGLAGVSQSNQDVFSQIGREVALQVIDAVWPPIVEAGSGSELIVNMGGDLISRGQHWEVYALGEIVRDSHSGSSLGRQERRVATVEITRSTQKMAYARVVKGEVTGTGHVLRRSAQSTMEDHATPSNRGTRKRTCLPIDPC